MSNKIAELTIKELYSNSRSPSTIFKRYLLIINKAKNGDKIALHQQKRQTKFANSQPNDKFSQKNGLIFAKDTQVSARNSVKSKTSSL